MRVLASCWNRGTELGVGRPRYRVLPSDLPWTVAQQVVVVWVPGRMTGSRAIDAAREFLSAEELNEFRGWMAWRDMCATCNEPAAIVASWWWHGSQVNLNRYCLPCAEVVTLFYEQGPDLVWKAPGVRAARPQQWSDGSRIRYQTWYRTRREPTRSPGQMALHHGHASVVPLGLA